MAIARAVLHRATSPWADTERANCNEWGGVRIDLLTIIHDPDECGGFRRGAEISRGDAQLMLLARCFTLGTRLCYPGHGEMEVVEYTYPVTHGTAVLIKTVQALRGRGFYLVPHPVVGKKFVHVGLHGQMRAR